jgi:hypothetical protein
MSIEDAVFAFEHILQETMKYGNFPCSGSVSGHKGRKQMFRQAVPAPGRQAASFAAKSVAARARPCGTARALMPDLRAVALRHDA